MARVLIFSAVADWMAGVRSFLAGRDLEVGGFRSWAELAPLLHDAGLSVVIMPARMGDFDGIEACRKIKERATFRAIPVFVIGEAALAEEAGAAGCDLFSPKHEARRNMIEALEKVVLPKERPVPRAAARFDICGQALFIVDDTADVGEMLNASRSGLLLAASRPVPAGSGISLRLQSVSGRHCDFEGVVRRVSVLPDSHGRFRHGLGIEFIGLSAEADATLDWLLAYRERRVPSWSHEAVSRILEADAELLSSLLQDETTRAFLDAFTGDLRPIERSELGFASIGNALVQSLVAARVQCAVCSTFVPGIGRGEVPATSGFFPLLRGLLARIRFLEERLEERIETSSTGERAQLVEAAERLFEEKLKLLFAVDENLSIDIPQEEDLHLLEDIRRQVAIQRLRRRSPQCEPLRPNTATNS